MSYILAICVKRMLTAVPERLKIGEPNRVANPDELKFMEERQDRGNSQEGGSDNEDGDQIFVFDDTIDQYVLTMMAIVSSDCKRILDCVVGNVSESFWKENHIGVNTNDVCNNGHSSVVDQCNLDEVDVDNVDPDSLELDI